MPNRLAASTSPYLRQHAENPVDWYPWGPEAFARAEAEDKPIFLSIGYSTCHWCHVMAHESFEDPEIAAFLNEHFVSIKVDREERPDVDRVYMSYVQAITGHGGWPLSAWLTPERMPFFGGTYFPPADRGGMRGFLSLLRAIADGWRKERQTLVNEATRVLATLAHHTRNAAAPAEPAPESFDLVDAGGTAFEQCFQHLHEGFDAENGGFGGAPKFPRASNLHFLFRAAVIQGLATEPGQEALRMALETLRAMARGGIHDHVGGGFHRYAVDGGWLVPHFEKMLYDQAQIAVNYLEAQQATEEPVYGVVARSIFDYVLRDLRDAGGGFYSAEDADSPTSDGSGHGGRGEGAFYLWTKSEIDALLGGASILVCSHFGVSEDGNVPEALDPHREFVGRNILHQPGSLLETANRFKLTPETASARLSEALERLRTARTGRLRPSRDEKIIAGWNGLMITALVKGAMVLRDRRLLQAAVEAGEFLRTHLTVDGRLHRSFHQVRGEVEAFAEDYANVVQAALDLYEGTADLSWLLWAKELQDRCDVLFWDEAGGGYFASAATDAHLVLRLKDDYDGAEPSANSVAATNLFRLRAFFPEDSRWQERGRRTLEGLRTQWTAHPQALPQLLCAIEWALEAPRQVVITGSPASEAFWELQTEVHRKLGPRRVVLYLTPENREQATQAIPALADYAKISAEPLAFVCEHFTCQAPVGGPADLRALLDRA